MFFVQLMFSLRTNFVRVEVFPPPPERFASRELVAGIFLKNVSVAGSWEFFLNSLSYCCVVHSRMDLMEATVVKSFLWLPATGNSATQLPLFSSLVCSG